MVLRWQSKGCVLICSCENSKIAIHCWATTNRRMVDPTKKRHPTSKVEGEAPARQQEGKDHIWNETPCLPETLRRHKWTPCVCVPRRKAQWPHKRLNQTCLWGQEMGTPHHLTCLAEKPVCRSRSKLELDMKQWTGSKLGKEYVKAVYCHLAYLTYMLNISCEIPDWMKHKLESRLQGEISVTSEGRWHHPYGRKWRRTKEHLDEKWKGEWKSWLKTQHSKN